MVRYQIDTKELARGRWKEILRALTSVTEEQLREKKQQPCLFCGGTDRYTFRDYQGSGSWYCRGACAPGGKEASNGFGFLMKYFNEDFKTVVNRVNEYLGVNL